MDFMCRFSDQSSQFFKVPSTRPFRKGPFFQIILGLDRLRVKRIEGELALPLYHGQKQDWIQHYYGPTQNQRLYYVQNVPETILEDVFQFLLILHWISCSDIPIPFVGQKAVRFVSSLQKRLLEIKEVMGSFDTSLQQRDYLMNQWRMFRDVGQALILNGKQLRDVMKAFEKRDEFFYIYITYIVSLFLGKLK